VRDGTTQSEESLTIVVEADNDAPTFAVGLDQTVQVRQRVVLDARARDPESQTVAYKWDQVSGPMVSLSQANDPKPSFTAPDSACELVFEVTVGDGETESKTKVSVSVREAPGR
jgi:hypothetical protein